MTHPRTTGAGLCIVLLITMGLERPSGQRYFGIARSLVRRGHRVRILALHPDLAQCQQRRMVLDGVEVWYVGQMHARKSGTLPQRFGPWQLLRVLVGATLGMLWGILCSPAGIYHLGKPQPVNGLAALIGVGLLRRQRFFVDCDDDEVESNRFTAAWQRWVFAFWQWLLPRLARGVTVNTQVLAQRMRRAGVTRVAYVPNGVDPARFTPPPARSLTGLRNALGLHNAPVAVYVGTLALHNHPVDLLLNAWAQVVVHQPSARLLLVGGGEDLLRLRDQVHALGLAAHVVFTGHVPAASVPTYLALGQLSVDPVRDDIVARARSPLKLFESLALGVPVITGAVGDRPAWLDHRRAGVLVPPGDPAPLAHAIAMLLADASRRDALAQAGLRHVQQYYWQELAAQWGTVYQIA